MSYPKRVAVRDRHSVEIEHLGTFIAISTPIKISQFPKKIFTAPTSRISKCVRTSKSVKNCENFKGCYFETPKKTPGIRNPGFYILWETGIVTS